MAGNQKYNTEYLVEKFHAVHGDEYDYTKVVYKHYREKIIVRCREHGDFSISINKHISGQGCPVCRYIKSAKSKRRPISEVISKMQEVHGDKYDYSLITEYINGKQKLPIICREHGVFYQSFDNHTRLKQGCPECGKKMYGEHQRLTTDEFIRKAKEVHGDKYDYSLVDYTLSQNHVKIICPVHGTFEQIARNHLFGQGCPKCFAEKSNIENEILDYIKSLVGESDVIENDRTVLDGREIDILVPSKNIGFEVNGLVWHSEKFESDRNYHLNKVLAASEKGIRLIHIFEDDWMYKEHIVKSRIANVLGKTKNVVYARQCVIRNVSYNISKFFLEQNHLQGNCQSKYRYGLYYNNELVSLMTFSKPRKNVARTNKNRDGEYEMTRFCVRHDYQIIGGASKLFNHFLNKIKPDTVVSYADRNWSDGNLYKQLGFVKYNESTPSYSYVINKKRVNRFNLRKDVLVEKYGCPIDMTEHEFCLSKGWYRIYDCGCLCYQYSVTK